MVRLIPLTLIALTLAGCGATPSLLSAPPGKFSVRTSPGELALVRRAITTHFTQTSTVPTKNGSVSTHDRVSDLHITAHGEAYRFSLTLHRMTTRDDFFREKPITHVSERRVSGTFDAVKNRITSDR